LALAEVVRVSIVCHQRERVFWGLHAVCAVYNVGCAGAAEYITAACWEWHEGNFVADVYAYWMLVLESAWAPRWHKCVGQQNLLVDKVCLLER
jgi:hypothetical protein